MRVTKTMVSYGAVSELRIFRLTHGIYLNIHSNISETTKILPIRYIEVRYFEIKINLQVSRNLGNHNIYDHNIYSDLSKGVCKDIYYHIVT